MRLTVRICIATALVFVLPATGESQVTLAWAATYRGPATEDNDNQAFAIVADPSGNVYVTGGSKGVSSRYEYATIKYSPSGDSLWIRRFGGTINMIARDITIDASGYLYVTGSATIKYDGNGSQVWVHENGAGALKVIVDAERNIYAGGTGIGAGLLDIVLTKIDSNGNRLWQSRYNGPGNDVDRAYDMALDPLGNVILVGETYSLVTGYDFLIIKYAPTGDTLWTRRYNGGPGASDDHATAVSVNALGNIYVTGWSDSIGTGTDALTIKYDGNGTMLWTKRYNSPTNGADTGDDIVVDRFGNAYVTGISQSISYAVHKYDNNGNHQWTAIYQGGGSAFSIITPKLSLDSAGNVYATVRVPDGQFDSNFGVVKYSSDGNKQWLGRHNLRGGTVNALALDRNENVYLTGFRGLSGVPGVTFEYLTVKFTQGPVSVGYQVGNIPTSLVLHQNYPNPFNPSTKIKFQIPIVSRVSLKVFDLLGREVAMLVNEQLSAGAYSTEWNAAGFAGGVYYYQLRAEDVVQTKKLILLR